MSAAVLGWHDEQQLERRRRTRNAFFVSLAVHALVFALFAVRPPRTFEPMPPVLSVELVSAPPSARARPAPSPPVEPAPEPEIAKPPPPPPPPKAPVQVLPEETPGKIRKVKEKPPPEPPKVVAKKPEPKPRRKPREQEEPLDLDDVMKGFVDELGFDGQEDLFSPQDAQVDDFDPKLSAAEPEDAGGPGMLADEAFVKWGQATVRRIRSVWVMPPNFRGLGLEVTLSLELSETGEVVGRPRVVRSSGDPYFDDNAVRAVMMANPLPRPVQSGTQPFVFRADAH